MTLRQIFVGAAAAVGLCLSAAPASAFIFGFQDGTAGGELLLNGGAADGGFTLHADFDAFSADPQPIGWYKDNGYHNLATGSYYVARAGDPTSFDGRGANDFFVFDLSALPDNLNIFQAQLRLWSGTVSISDWLRLGSYTGDITKLENGTGGRAAYDGLANGVAYGFQYYLAGEYPQGQDGSWQLFDLNSAFLHDVNAAESKIVIGGTVRGPNEPPPPPAVPEPATWTMMLAGFLGAGAALRARRRALASA